MKTEEYFRERLRQGRVDSLKGDIEILQSFKETLPRCPSDMKPAVMTFLDGRIGAVFRCLHKVDSDYVYDEDGVLNPVG